jgi:hypothetical protein
MAHNDMLFTKISMLVRRKKIPLAIYTLARFWHLRLLVAYPALSGNYKKQTLMNLYPSKIVGGDLASLLSVYPSSFYGYVLAVFAVPLIVRLEKSLFVSVRLRKCSAFCVSFYGIRAISGSGFRVTPDYWLSFFLGMLEMLAYPFLIVTNHPLIIGSWLTFKTVHRMSYARGVPRGPYNQYLVGNALILIGAYCSARWAVAP